LKPNPCKKHDGAHDWKNCPDNPYSKKNGTKGESKGDTKGKKELHSTQSTNKSTKKTPEVCINEEPEIKSYDKNRFSDLNYSSDGASAKMVHAPSSDQVNGITIIEMPTKDGSRFGTTILIDNGFTGYAIMSHNAAETLGLEFEPISGQSYVTVTGNMDTKFQVTVHGIRLPHLSRHRTFSATFEIAPKESGDFGFGVITGIDMMDDLGIDTSRTTKWIIWGNDSKFRWCPRIIGQKLESKHYVGFIDARLKTPQHHLKIPLPKLTFMWMTASQVSQCSPAHFQMNLHYFWQQTSQHQASQKQFM